MFPQSWRTYLNLAPPNSGAGGLIRTVLELTLPPGEHTLQLILGNYAHVPHDNPVMSEEITVTVK